MIFHPMKTASFLIAVSLMSFSQPAFAGEIQDQIKLCSAALDSSKSELIANGHDDIKFRFKSIQGASLKRISFLTKIDGEKTLVTCHIKRKKVRKLTRKNGTVFGDFNPKN